MWPHGLQSARLLCRWNYPGKNTGVGCHFFLQASFPTWESTAWQVDSLPLYMHIPLYICIYIYIYIHTYLYIYTYTYIFCVYIYMYVYLYVYIGRHTYKYLHKPKSASEISSHSAAFCVTYWTSGYFSDSACGDFPATTRYSSVHLIWFIIVFTFHYSKHGFIEHPCPIWFLILSV